MLKIILPFCFVIFSLQLKAQTYNYEIIEETYNPKLWIKVVSPKKDTVKIWGAKKALKLKDNNNQLWHINIFKPGINSAMVLMAHDTGYCVSDTAHLKFIFPTGLATEIKSQSRMNCKSQVDILFSTETGLKNLGEPILAFNQLNAIWIYIQGDYIKIALSKKQTIRLMNVMYGLSLVKPKK